MNKEKNQKPLVSIVIPVRNAANFLQETLESILAQTYTNWELIAVNDNSQDNSLVILKEYSQKDKRIKVFSNPKHQGVSRTANLAISKTKGQFIARIDADDVMLPKRIEKQVKFLLKSPSVVAVGGQCILIDEDGQKIGEKTFPCQHKDIYRMIYQAMPIQQPTLMVNTALLPKNFVWYENEFSTAEEVDFIFRLFKYGQCANLKDYVLKYRIHQNNLSLKDPKKTFFLTYQTRKEATRKYGYQPALAARIINFFQWAIVSLLPKPVIFPLFVLWRGLV